MICMSRVMIGEHLTKLRLICGFASRFERRSCSPLLLPEIPGMVQMLCACQGTARLTRMAVLRARGIPPGTTTTETARLRPPKRVIMGIGESSNLQTPKVPKLPKVPKKIRAWGLRDLVGTPLPFRYLRLMSMSGQRLGRFRIFGTLGLQP